MFSNGSGSEYYLDLFCTFILTVKKFSLNKKDILILFFLFLILFFNYFDVHLFVDVSWLLSSVSRGICDTKLA